VIGKAAIYGAVRPGSRVCRGQLDWVRTGLSMIEAQPWYVCRKDHYAAILRRLAAHMDWRLRTTRPGHDLLRCQTCRGSGRAADASSACPACGGKPLSADTVGRAVAWFQANGLLGLVSPGTTPLLRAHVLHGGEGNLAAVYVCTVPGKRSRLRRMRDAGDREFADLSSSRSEVGKAPRAREAQPNTTTARAPRGLSLLPPISKPNLHTWPKNRTEALGMAQVMQDRFPVLRRLSPEHVRHLTWPFMRARPGPDGTPRPGWTAEDCLHALDHDQSGRPHGYTTAVRFPAAWAQARLARWLSPDGTPLPSPSQLRRERHERDRAEQAQRRADRDRAAAAAADTPQWAAHARGELSASSEQARGALARAAIPEPSRRPRGAAASHPHSPAQIRLAQAVAEDAGMPLRGAVLARALLAARDPAARRAILDRAAGAAADADQDGA
jgi:hypothetical protein